MSNYDDPIQNVNRNYLDFNDAEDQSSETKYNFSDEGEELVAVNSNTLDYNDAEDQYLPLERVDKDEIRRRLIARLPDALRYLYHNGNFAGKRFEIGSVHGEKGQSLKVTLEGPDAGRWQDFNAEEKGDIFRLWGIAHKLDCKNKRDFRKIMESIQKWLGMPQPVRWNDAEQNQKTPKLEKAKDSQIANLKAQNDWAKAFEPVDNPYLKRKQVDCHGVRQSGGNTEPRLLLIPVRDTAGNLHTLQTIDDNGNKRFLSGGAKKGHFYTIGALSSSSTFCYVAEGYATAASVYEATGIPTLCAFGAGNLMPAIENLMDKYPNLKITIAADNDCWGKDKSINPGINAAKRCAEKFDNVNFVFPKFKEQHNASLPKDFNDLICLEGIEEVKLQINAEPIAVKPNRELNIFNWGTTDIYDGEPPVKKFLVDGFFPLASACLFVATGGVGKGMLILDLALNVAGSTSEESAFGPQITEHGSVVIFSAEDDKDEIHRRLCNIDTGKYRFNLPPRNEFLVIPLPNDGGAFPIIEQSRDELKESDKFKKICEQLKTINNLKMIVFDPLASFVRADVNSDPSAGAFLMGTLQKIATETGACVIATHHMSKSSKDKGRPTEPETLEELYHYVRGTSALGNGARAVYVIGIASEATQKDVFKKLNKPKQRNAVYIGGIGKANGLANWEQQIFLRSEIGLLKNVTAQINKKTLNAEDLEKLIIKTISDQEDNNAFTKTGDLGVFARKHEFSDELQSLSKHALENIVQELLNKKKLCQCAKMGGNKYQYLGIPGGPLSQGIVQDKFAPIIYDPTLTSYLLESIFQAEKDGQPFNKKGTSCVWSNKGRLSLELQILNQKQLRKMVEDVIKEKSVAVCIHGREKNAQWLCDPNGSLATDPDNYEFKTGSI